MEIVHSTLDDFFGINIQPKNEITGGYESFWSREKYGVKIFGKYLMVKRQ